LLPKEIKQAFLEESFEEDTLKW